MTSNGWDRTEASLALRDTSIFDLGDHVYFYYDNRLYRAGSDGFLAMEPPRWHEAQPGRNRILGVRWDNTRAMLVNYGKRAGVFAFDLRTCREVPLDAAREALRNTDVYDAFSLPDGSVWLLGFTQGQRTYTFLSLSTDGTVTPVAGTQELPWDNTRCWQFPDSVLVTSSGAIVFGLPQDGIAIWHNGKLSRYGWREGFSSGVQQILEDPKGSLWAPVGTGIVCFRPDAAALPRASVFDDWTEYLLVPRTRIWEVEPGCLAMFRADKPDALSRWNGTHWRFQPVPFDCSQIGRSMVDDRGHLIVQMGAAPDGVFDVSPDKIERFDAMEPLLAATARQGVKDFSQYDGFQGVVAASSNRVWFGYHNYNSVLLIEETRTDSFSFRDDVYYLYPSAIHDALFRTQGGRFYKYDRGQMVEVPPSLSDAKTLLLGDNGLQPYERALALKMPLGRYPVLRSGSERRLFFSPDDFDSVVEGINSDEPSVVLPPHAERLYPSTKGGAWLECSQGGGNPVRIFAKRRFDLDLSETPMHGRIVRRAREDCAGNLWFETDAYAGSGHAFVRRLSEVRLIAKAVPTECGRQLRLALEVSPAHYAPEIHGLVRLAPSDWTMAGTNGLDLLILFPHSGEYTVEVSGLLMGARLQSPRAFTVAATVALPNTFRTDEGGGEVSVQDPFWFAPIRAERTIATASLAVLWRLDGQAWQRLSLHGPLNLARLKPGNHRVEFAAEEDEFWSDPTPVSIPIRYAPDYDKAVARRVRNLLDADRQVRQQAMRELVQLGPDALQAVLRRTEAAETEARLAPLLRQVLMQMNENHRPQR